MSRAAFALLHPGVRRAVWEMGWKELRPIQVQAIHALLESRDPVLITAGTAAGKTEAAFLPIISRVADRPHDSFRALYIGPLKALINDQFERLARLCERLGIPVHRWHGDVSAAHKQALRQQPGGILLITPESLESSFLNYSPLIPRMFRGLEFVVIDELHAFVDSVRGIHLLSLLARLQAATGRHPRRVGLSATLGDPAVGQHFLSPEAPQQVRWIAEPGGGRQVRYALKAVLRPPSPAIGGDSASRLTPDQAAQFACSRTREQLLAPVERAPAQPHTLTQPPRPDDLDDLVEELIRHFALSTNLVFVNSRRTGEMLMVRLHDRVRERKWPHDPFMLHHGSVAKALRQETEESLKSGVPTTVICTSTLELGVDIGSVRAVAQIDPPWRVSSLVQRLGRSGRRLGEAAILRLYVREESPHAGSRLTDLLFPDLLRGIALTRLMLSGWLEPAALGRMHLSTLVHQVLSCLKQTGGTRAEALYDTLLVCGPFRGVTAQQFALLLRGLAAKGLVEQVPTGELILAPAGERVTGAHDFYAAFTSVETFSVRHGREEIGELPVEGLPEPGRSMVLAGRRWVVEEVDGLTKVVWVSPARGGEPPMFPGPGGELNSRVVQEMRAVLLDTSEPAYLDPAARVLLHAARQVARRAGLDQTSVLRVPGGVQWFPWVGTRCLRTLALRIEEAGVACEPDQLSLRLRLASEEQFRKLLAQLAQPPSDPMVLARRVIPRIVEKFDEFVAEPLLLAAIVSDRLDIPGSMKLAQDLLHS